jgi:AraC-like DNA-binding protein
MTPPSDPRAERADVGAFGERMGRCYHLASAPSLLTTSFKTGQLAATRLFRAGAGPGLIETMPVEDSFVCQLQLSTLPLHEVRCGERIVLARNGARHSIGILDLRDRLSVRIGSPLDALSFHLPRPVLDEFCDDVGARRIERLSCEPGHVDPVLAHLGAALLPELHRPTEASALFFDQLALAISAHLLQRYGGLGAPRRAPAGGLTADRERRAKELLAAGLDGELSIADIAARCGLSRAYFSEAFRQRTGVTPHQWLQRHKVEKVQGLLLGSDASIAEAALACGFADQSHLTRTFTRIVGIAPAAWRRQRRFERGGETPLVSSARCELQ